MWNRQWVIQWLCRASQVGAVLAAFAVIYLPELRGRVLSWTLGVSTAGVYIYGLLIIYQQGYLSKTAAEIYAQIRARPRTRFRIELTLNLLIMIFSSMASDRL